MPKRKTTSGMERVCQERLADVLTEHTMHGASAGGAALYPTLLMKYFFLQQNTACSSLILAPSEAQWVNLAQKLLLMSNTRAAWGGRGLKGRKMVRGEKCPLESK